MYEWDEAKREANLRKHGLDFVDADSVYENPNKITFAVLGRGEARWLDMALVELNGIVLALVYTVRGYNVRIISFLSLIHISLLGHRKQKELPPRIPRLSHPVLRDLDQVESVPHAGAASAESGSVSVSQARA